MPGDNGDGTIETLDDSEVIDEEADIRVLVDDEGNEMTCLLLAVIEHEGEEFALLSPMSEVDGDGAEMEVYVLKYAIEDGQEHFDEVDDEDTFNAVVSFASTLFETTPDDA